MCNNLDTLITKCSKKWQLSNIRPLAPMINNYVALAYSDLYQQDVVLKILLADTAEIETLKFFNGDGCVKLLDYDSDAKVFLLEYIQPGTSLKTLFPHHDDQAVHIVADVIKKLHAMKSIPLQHSFKNIAQWLQLLDTFQSKKIPLHSLEKARILYKQLLEKEQKQYVLHGDLHHDNILQSSTKTGSSGIRFTNAWMAIDPKGVIGPLEYEVGRFIMNPIPDLLQQENTQEIIDNRIKQFSYLLCFEQQRIRDWCFVQAILSACWAEEGSSKEFFDYFVRFAQMIEMLK